MKVLVVDDILVNVYLLKTLLTSRGYEVTEAANGREALDIARHSPPELIVSDILMPVMDGFALCREWKEDPVLNNIPFVFYTATYTEQKDHDFALSLGADRFLVKPMENHAFLHEVLEVVRLHKEKHPQAKTASLQESTEYYQQYNARLVNKLEDKHIQLELKNQELTRQNRELQESEKRVQLLLNSTAEAIFGLDNNGRCTFANQACLRLLGYDDVEKLLNKNMHRIMQHSYANGLPYPEDKSFISMSYLEGKDMHSDSEVLWRSDGSKFSAEYWAHPINEGGRCIGAVVTFLDITQRKEAEDALRQHRDQLENTVQQRTSELMQARDQALQANRSKSMFLANMSHELRTPLNSIIGFTAIVGKGKLGTLNEEQTRQLGMAHDSAQHLLSMINDILDISKVEAGKEEIVLERFDLGSLLIDLVEMLKPQFETKGLTSRVEVDKGGVELCTDREKLWHILLNLLSNALKFTHQGQVIIRTRTDAEHFIIEVEDTGIGIDDKDLGYIFNAFEQVDNHVGRQYAGTGLGLTICRQYLYLLGGDINVKSTLGNGSCFCVMLPVSSLVNEDISQKSDAM